MIVTARSSPKVPHADPVRVARARVTTLEATPEFASLKGLPPTDGWAALVQGTPPAAVTDPPVGAVRSMYTVALRAALFPATSRIDCV